MRHYIFSPAVKQSRSQQPGPLITSPRDRTELSGQIQCCLSEATMASCLYVFVLVLCLMRPCMSLPMNDETPDDAAATEEPVIPDEPEEPATSEKPVKPEEPASENEVIKPEEPASSGPSQDDQFVNSCWKELEWRATRLYELGFTELSSPDLNEYMKTPSGRQKLFCLLIHVYDISSLNEVVPNESRNNLQFFLGVVRTYVNDLGWQEGIQNLGKALKDFFQLWIDADISSLPVSSSKKAKLDEMYTQSAPVISTALRKVPAIDIGYPFFTSGNLAPLFESSTIQDLSRRSGISVSKLQSYLPDKAKVLQEMSQLAYGIVNELLDKNWMGMACYKISVPETATSGSTTGGPAPSTASCWPELKATLQHIIRRANENKKVQEALTKASSIKISTLGCDGNLEWLVCKVESIKTLSDFLGMYPGTIGNGMKIQYMVYQAQWLGMGGMDGARKLAETVESGIDLWFEIDFPNQIPVTSMTKEELTSKLKEVVDVIPNILDIDEPDAEKLADALVDSSNLIAFTIAMGISPGEITSLYKMGDTLRVVKNLLPHMLDLAEKLDSHGFMNLQ